MPKSQYVDPVFLRKSGEITYKPTPVCAYDKTVADEKNTFKKEVCLRIFHDMAVIREYETMLNSIKTTSSYHGIEYNNPGPAHLSAGQEAAAVGQAYILDKDDFVFGSHRSHGEIIAKALSAIQKCSDKELEEIMTTYMDGKVLKVVEHYKGFADPHGLPAGISVLSVLPCYLREVLAVLYYWVFKTSGSGLMQHMVGILSLNKKFFYQ